MPREVDACCERIDARAVDEKEFPLRRIDRLACECIEHPRQVFGSRIVRAGDDGDATGHLSAPTAGSLRRTAHSDFRANDSLHQSWWQQISKQEARCERGERMPEPGLRHETKGYGSLPLQHQCFCPGKLLELCDTLASCFR